jgi:hypothetical protein
VRLLCGTWVPGEALVSDQIVLRHNAAADLQLVILTLQWQHHQASRRTNPCHTSKVSERVLPGVRAAANKVI